MQQVAYRVTILKCITLSVTACFNLCSKIMTPTE